MRRNVTVGRALVVPVLAGLGTVLLGYGHRLALADASHAARLPVQAMAVVSAASPSTALRQPGDPEFGGVAPTSTESDLIHSITPLELRRQARENSGREDPFVSLILPEAHLIVPLSPPAPKPMAYVPAPPPPKPVVRRLADGHWISAPVVVRESPQWIVQGIINTGRDQMVLLVDRDNNAIQASAGQVLPDGSRVVSISDQQVTLLFRGQRFIKTIGGQDSQ